MIRLFIGIKMNHQDIFKKYQQELQIILPESKINWTSEENFHITLKFLGDVKSYFVNSIKMVLEHITGNCPAFELISDRIGYFGKDSSPKVIWYGFKENQMISSLQNHIASSLERLGFDIEEKRFYPHITLARIKYLKELEEFKEFITGNKIRKIVMRVEDIQLYKSILTQSGPEYTILENFILNKN
ncbi:MAG: RNA 2',3'-cyclic phosphodiesterase [Bacteroidales bacterium]|nr:RNA 2',3'-cyclic phosphodiesterase [Bacteroidales bacterium]